MHTAGFVNYPHAGRGWIPFAVESGSRIIEREKVDAIISVWPITAHLIAKRLKHNSKIPWIADFSHLWSQGYYYQYGPVRKILDRKLEAETLRSADALTTISQFFVTILQELHKQKTIYPITHGFDPSWVNSTISTMPGFTITYTGNVYKGKHQPSKLFTALNELINEGVLDRKDVEVLFYGAIQGWLQEEIDRYNLSDIVHQCGVVSHPESLQKQHESQILLHLGWDDTNIKGFYTSKLFEYLAAKRPVLAVGGASAEVVRDLLCETKAGVYCLTIEEIKDALYYFYKEYKREGMVSYNGDIEKVNNYSHREMAKKFADVLDSLI